MTPSAVPSPAVASDPVLQCVKQRGGRPFIAFLPARVRDVKLVTGAELNPVVADDFILVPNPGVCDPEKPLRVVFTASPMR